VEKILGGVDMRIFGRKHLGFLGGIAALCAGPVALAWDGYPTGFPGTIEVAQGVGNRNFRVSYSPAVAMCGNGNTWAYLNDTDSNYSINVATILAAKAQGLRITVYSNVDGTGSCHIGYLVQH
jgi:hypothetical protein